MTSSSNANLVWAKSNDMGGEWLPLWMHLRDTFQIAGWIWENYIPDVHRNLITEELNIDDFTAQKLYQILCGLHDVGKCIPDFSGRKRVQFDTAPLYDRMQSAGFDYSGYNIMRGDRQRLRHELGSDYYLRKFANPQNKRGTADSILVTIAAHHGTPIQITKEQINSLDGTLKQNPLWEHSAKECYDFILDNQSDYRNILDYAMEHGISWRTQMVFSGYVSLADWSASNSDLFPLFPFEQLESPSWEIHPDRLSYATSAIDLPAPFDPSGLSVPDDSFSVSDLFQKRFGFSTPRPMQEDFVNLVNNKSIPANDLFILEAPMGEGKTEALLAASEALMRRTGRTGFFFGMPTMATGEAIYNRVFPFVNNMLIEHNQGATLELMHSKSSLSESRHQNRRKSQNQITGVIESSFLSGRYLKHLNSFVVGTVDNLLMLQLPVKYAYWRHVGMSQKVIIVDEVHSMDSTMKHFLVESLRVSGFYGCPVILASATLKESERQRYITAYNEGKNMGNKLPLLAPGITIQRGNHA